MISLRMPGKAVVWPANIDSTKTRNHGRKISKSTSVDSPKLSEIEEAAKILGLEPVAVANASRPNAWWEKTGYVIVNKKGMSKSLLLKQIASAISKLRQARTTGDGSTRFKS
jgi:signal recognition particle subunit SRP19